MQVKKLIHDRAEISIVLTLFVAIVTLIPFFIFSIFHTLSYFNSNIIPLIIPTTNDDNQDSKTKGPEIISKIDSNIQYFTDNYHATAMQYVAYIEVIGILGRLVLGLLM